MNILVLPITEIIPEYIYYLDSKNNMLMDGIFTKVIYTNEWFTMNGLYINLPIEIKWDFNGKEDSIELYEEDNE